MSSKQAPSHNHEKHGIFTPHSVPLSTTLGGAYKCTLSVHSLKMFRSFCGCLFRYSLNLTLFPVVKVAGARDSELNTPSCPGPSLCSKWRREEAAEILQESPRKNLLGEVKPEKKQKLAKMPFRSHKAVKKERHHSMRYETLQWLFICNFDILSNSR